MYEGSGEDGDATGIHMGAVLEVQARVIPDVEVLLVENLKELRERCLGHWGRRRS